MSSGKFNETPSTGDRFVNEASGEQEASFAQIVMVGRTDDASFEEIRRFLNRCSFVQILSEFETLPQLFESGSLPDPVGPPDPADNTVVDLVIVLQSTSDQYAIDDIHRLVGTMLFGRVLCCYGPWCVSDGRSHDLWPVSLRIPAASAVPVIASELEGFRKGLVPISPMAASEELLTYRMENVEEHRRSPGKSSYQRLLPESHQDAIVISPDSTFRLTLTQLLNSADFHARDAFDVDAALTQLRSHRFTGTVIIDIDAFSETDLQPLRDPSRSRTLQLVGVTGFPVQPADRKRFGLVLEKSELFWQLGLL